MTAPAPNSPTSGGPPSDRAAALTVRRDVRRDLRSVMILLGIAVLLVFWVPAVIVLVRPEAAYFTNGILWSALIATVLVLLAGAGLTLWWSRRGRVQLSIDADGVTLPARRKQPALTLRWDELALIKLVGVTDPALAFYPREEQDEEEDDEEDDELDLSEPEFLRPLDFTNDPPPQMRVPDRATFERITPLPTDDETEEPEPELPKPAPGTVLHATPHVVRLVRPNPPLPDVLRAIAQCSAGRVPLD